MNLSATLLFYLTIGLGAGVAVFVIEPNSGILHRGFTVLSAVLFWPLYVPVLLTAPRPTKPPAGAAATDGMAAAIVQVERELAAALASLDGWAENVLDRQGDRLHELSAALELQAARVRDMDALADRTRSAGDALSLDAMRDDGPPAVATGETLDRFRQSEQARTNNLARLAEVRRAAYTDLMATLAWIRELVSMIHLAKFTGAPAARAEELVAQIAAAVEGISAATWHEESALR
jgi:hypothetical protein